MLYYKLIFSQLPHATPPLDYCFRVENWLVQRSWKLLKWQREVPYGLAQWPWRGGILAISTMFDGLSRHPAVLIQLDKSIIAWKKFICYVVLMPWRPGDCCESMTVSSWTICSCFLLASKLSVQPTPDSRQGHHQPSCCRNQIQKNVC